jgi:hypothetical protein
LRRRNCAIVASAKIVARGFGANNIAAAMARMVRIQIQLPSDQVSRLREIARENHTSIAGMVRKSVTDALQRPTITPLRRDRWERSVGAIGRFAAGQSHDSFRRSQ